jgi:type II secretory pathway pseudopilin PulG
LRGNLAPLKVARFVLYLMPANAAAQGGVEHMINNRIFPSRQRAGVTLMELLISLVILGFAFGAILATLSYTYKASYTTKRFLFASTLAQSSIEDARGFPFTTLETSPVPFDSYEVDGDLSGSGGAVVYQVQMFFKGYGAVESASPGGLVANRSQGQAEMNENEFAGHHLYIVSGTGAGQIREIASNDADSFTIGDPWDVVPNATSRFRVDGGATVETVVRWRDGSRNRQLRTRGLIFPRL